jgi:hypothetical protein
MHAATRLATFATLECGPAPLLVMVGRAMEPLLTNDSGDSILEPILAAAFSAENSR